MPTCFEKRRAAARFRRRSAARSARRSASNFEPGEERARRRSTGMSADRLNRLAAEPHGARLGPQPRPAARDARDAACETDRARRASAVRRGGVFVFEQAPARRGTSCRRRAAASCDFGRLQLLERRVPARCSCSVRNAASSLRRRSTSSGLGIAPRRDRAVAERQANDRA